MSDPILQALTEARTQPQPESNWYQITQLLSEWKTSFSLKWYTLYSSPSQLETTWLTLFELTEFPNESVNVASFNAIGAFLVALCPFYPLELIDSLGSIIDQIQVSAENQLPLFVVFSFFRAISPRTPFFGLRLAFEFCIISTSISAFSLPTFPPLFSNWRTLRLNFTSLL
jgi:hypothetical protein